MAFDRRIFLKELFACGKRTPNPEDIEETELLHSKISCNAATFGDLHLGSPFCCSQDIVQFLDHIAPKTIFLNGDIIESWRNRFSLPKLYKRDPLQAACFLKLSKLAQQGVKVVFTPGNHDRIVFDDAQELPIEDLTIASEASHTTGDGKRILIRHGNEFDGAIFGHPWLSAFGSLACEAAGDLSFKIDKWRTDAKINRAFKMLGFHKRWSLEKALQNAYEKTSYNKKFGKAARDDLFAINAEIFSRNKEETGPAEKFFDEVVCGHTHIPFHTECSSPCDEDGNLLGPKTIAFSNTGCWTGFSGHKESLRNRFRNRSLSNTAIIECNDGRRKHVQWIPGLGIVEMHVRSDGSFKAPSSRKNAKAMLAPNPL